MQADPDEELEHLKELLAEAEELCLVLALEKHLEAQRAERVLELLSKRNRGVGSNGMENRVKPDGAPHYNP